MLPLIARLAPLVLRHLSAYADVAGEDAREAAALVARKLVRVLAAAACGFIALLMACILLVALAWDTPWRGWTAAGLAVAFAVAAVALAWPVLRRGPSPHALFFPRIRTELTRDRELIERAFDGQGKAGNGHEQRAD
jgi:uncharacterized membrane protein YqjE